MSSLHRQMQVGFVVVPAALGLQLFAMLLIANHFGPERWGVFVVVLSFMQVAAFVTEMGLEAIITKLVAEAKRPAGDYIALALLPVLGVAAVVAVLLIVVLCLAYSPDLVGGISLVTAVNILFFGPSLVLSSTLRGLGRIGQWQIGFIGQKLILLTMVLAVLRPFEGGLATAMGAWTVANACILVYYAGCLWGREWHGQVRWSPSEIKALVREAIPVGLISVTNQLALHLDTFVVAALAGRGDVGVYAISQRLINPARNVVRGAVITPTFPGLCRLARTDPGEFARRTTRLMLIQWLSGLTMSVGAFVLAPWVLPLLLSSDFNDSIAVLQITAWALPPAFLIIQFRYMYIALSQQKRFLRMNVAYVALKAALLIPFTWRYGIWGACFATVAAEILMAAIVRASAASIGVRLELAWRITVPAAGTALLGWVIWRLGTDRWSALLLAFAYSVVSVVFLNRLLKTVRRNTRSGSDPDCTAV